MKLQSRLDEVKRQLIAVLDQAERAELEVAIERLRMLQIVEQGLAIGDVLPDFALPDRAGQIVASDDLLACGPLVLTFFRGPWCPYCSMTLEALNQILPAVERLGGLMVAVAPLPCEELDRMAGGCRANPDDISTPCAASLRRPCSPAEVSAGA
jgi:thiol-disulfide isomerase/thioredoxin